MTALWCTDPTPCAREFTCHPCAEIMATVAAGRRVSEPVVPLAEITYSDGTLDPDLLRYVHFGPADFGRGRVVRAFFWLMRFWPA